MKKNTNIRKIASALLALFVFTPHVASAIRDKDLLDEHPNSKPKPGASSRKSLLVDNPKEGAISSKTGQLRDHDYYKAELRKLEESTVRIHKEVERILKAFRHNMDEYRKHTRRTGATTGTRSKKITTTESDIKPTYTEEELRDLKNDPLRNYDYTHQLKIPIMTSSSGINKLKIRDKPQNRSGGLREDYKIEGRTFKRQNVSGGGLDCFFNSVGLTRPDVIKDLKANRNKPIVRYIIANEIVSASANPEQLPTTLKTAIDYTLYRKEMEALNSLYEIRSSLLLAQNKNANAQDPSKLPPEYQKLALDKKENMIRENLRIRATSLEAFYAFVDHYIGGGNMMATFHETKGEVGDNLNANYTSIDAMAYLNNFGIRIYKPNEGCMLYFMSNDATIDPNHTPAIKKIGDNKYHLFVRTGSHSVSKALDPANLGIDVKGLGELWDKKIWNKEIQYQTQFLKFNNKIMEKIITMGNHFQPEESQLHLTHQFIPQGAKEIVYVYFEGNYIGGHYQALIPQ